MFFSAPSVPTLKTSLNKKLARSLFVWISSCVFIEEKGEFCEKAIKTYRFMEML